MIAKIKFFRISIISLSAVFLIGCHSLEGLKKDLKSITKNNESPKINFYINFDNNSDQISSASKLNLDKMAQIIEEASSKNQNALIVGHTDSSGPSDYNWELSLRRANAVVEYLIKYYKISPEKLRYDGKGEDEPLISPEKTEQDKIRNRRVELIILPVNTKS